MTQLRKARTVQERLIPLIKTLTPLYQCYLHLLPDGFWVAVKAPKSVLSTIPHEMDGVKIEHIPTL